MSNDLFFKLIQVAIGVSKQFSYVPTTRKWEKLYLMAERQSVLGVCFKTVKDMANSVPQSLYMNWLAAAAMIKQWNEEMNGKCAKVYEAIRREGFGCAVLKGQGVAELYANSNEALGVRNDTELGLYRQSGDIDVWLWKEGLSLKERMTAYDVLSE